MTVSVEILLCGRVCVCVGVLHKYTDDVIAYRAWEVHSLYMCLLFQPYYCILVNLRVQNITYHIQGNIVASHTYR